MFKQLSWRYIHRLFLIIGQSCLCISRDMALHIPIWGTISRRYTCNVNLLMAVMQLKVGERTHKSLWLWQNTHIQPARDYIHTLQLKSLLYNGTWFWCARVRGRRRVSTSMPRERGRQYTRGSSFFC